MATLGNKKTYSGMAGNVVFRNLDGKQIMQSRPSRVKQTSGTKISASEFGSCSQWTKKIRLGLAPFLVGLTDSTMHSRFSTALYNTIKGNTALPKGERTPLNSPMESLQGFEFNTHSPFADYFRQELAATLTAANEITVSLPAFDTQDTVIFPIGCNNAKLAVFAYATDFADNTTPLIYHNLVPLNKNTSLPAQSLLTTAPLPEGHFVLVSVKLLYYNQNLLTESNYLNTRDFSPAMVVLAGVTA